MEKITEKFQDASLKDVFPFFLDQQQIQQTTCSLKSRNSQQQTFLKMQNKTKQKKILIFNFKIKDCDYEKNNNKIIMKRNILCLDYNLFHLS